MSTDDDERSFQRVQANFRVRSSALNLEGVGTDLSEGGLFVQSVRYFPINAVVRLTVELPNGNGLPATCRVAFVRDAQTARREGKAQGMGREIVVMAPADREQWDWL
jgi:Tfp pilus assembly protein PilZ